VAAGTVQVDDALREELVLEHGNNLRAALGEARDASAGRI